MNRMIFSTLACATKSCASASAKQIKTLVKNPRFGMVMMLLFVFTIGVFAQDAAGNFSAGTKALTTATEENAFWLNHTQIKYDKMNIKLKKTRYK